jgi:hypothetical protein
MKTTVHLRVVAKPKGNVKLSARAGDVLDAVLYKNVCLFL